MALAAAAPLLLPGLTVVPPLHDVERGPGGEGLAETGNAQQANEPSALAKALAEGIRLRYGDRLSADDLAVITRGIDGRLRGVDRLYQVALTNGDEPDFVFRAYRGPA